MAASEQAKFHPVTNIIMDVDGLLVDSEYQYSDALTIVCRRYNRCFDWTIKSRMMGTKPMEGAEICLEALDLVGKIKPEDFIAQYEEEMEKNCHKIKLLPGAERLIKHLSNKGIPMAIATGSSEARFIRKTTHLGDILRKPFSHHVFAGSDPEVPRGKPHPDVFEVAARRFKSPPSDKQNFLVFEDAINGVKAALDADMQVVFVPDKRLDTNNMTVKPTVRLNSLVEFRPEQFGLPPFDE